jgi:hypothetical protein
MFHNSQAVLALSLTSNDTIFQKTLPLNDFYFGMEGFPYPMGQHPDDRKDASRHVSRGEVDFDRAGAQPRLEWISCHAVDFWLTTEDLPDPDNRVTVDTEGRITFAYKPNNQVPMQKLYEKLRSMLSDIGLQLQHLVRPGRNRWRGPRDACRWPSATAGAVHLGQHASHRHPGGVRLQPQR